MPWSSLPTTWSPSGQPSGHTEPQLVTDPLTDLLTRRRGTRETTRIVGDSHCPDFPGQRDAPERRRRGKMCVVVLITQRQQAHNRDMTQEHPKSSLTAALHWALDHLPKWRRRPPTAGVREPRRPKPSLPAAAVALKEPRVGLMRWIKLDSRRSDDQTLDRSSQPLHGCTGRGPSPAGCGQSRRKYPCTRRGTGAPGTGAAYRS
jgi:hypothetical protein